MSHRERIISIRHIPSRLPVSVTRNDNEYNPLLIRDYTRLSPGLERRMSYSNYIRYRRYISNNLNNLNNLTNLTNLTNSNDVNDIIFMNDIISRINSTSDITLKNLLLKTKIKINYNDFFCPICQCEDNKDSDKNSNNIIQRQLGCDHVFHMECIDKWLIIKKECPLCKKIV